MSCVGTTHQYSSVFHCPLHSLCYHVTLSVIFVSLRVLRPLKLYISHSHFHLMSFKGLFTVTAFSECVKMQFVWLKLAHL